MRLTLWPRSLAARTALVLLVGLVAVQTAGLVIHAFDRLDLQRLAQVHDVAQRTMNLYRGLVLIPQDERVRGIASIITEDDQTLHLSDIPPDEALPPAPPELQRQLMAEMQLVPIPVLMRPRDMVFLGGGNDAESLLVIGLRFPDGGWLHLQTDLSPPRPWHSFNFLMAFAMMTLAAGLLSLWAVRRLTRPVAVLARAAERLGRDVNAAPLPETGPAEVAMAAAAFNTMAARIRRFVQDRTLMLTAIGHDLRTPITRLRLRAEFVEDEIQRGRMLADLDELEAMVSATLTFGRDAAVHEAVVRLDLAELLRTILDEAVDMRPELEGRIAIEGPAHLTVAARPLALKRAFANLVGNAINYGGGVQVRLCAEADGEAGKTVTIHFDDTGPGIPPDDVERMFQPFQRLEASRNRETGGVGLGLPIARNILRAHGGDVAAENRTDGPGLRVRVTLPV
jgi:hypothetical protein